MAADEKRTISFEVKPKVFDTLAEMAAERHARPAVYAKMLFEAAYSARLGIQSDTDLDAAIARAVLLSAKVADSAELAAVTGMSEPTVVRVLGAWRDETRRKMEGPGKGAAA